MKKLMWVSILLLLSFPASNGVARPQQSQHSQTMQSQQGPQEQGYQESGGQLQWSQKSSDILNKKIISIDGKELGTAEDLVIGKDGKIEYVILSIGGFLGIGGEKVAVPWDKIRPTPNINQLLADVSQSEIQRHSGENRKSEEAAPMPLAQVDSERAKELMYPRVVGKDGEELGKAMDLFSSPDGRPMYVVVQDESGQLHPVPAELVLARPENRSLSADIDKQAFQSSPTFDQFELSEQQWEPEVRGYYQGGFQGRQADGQQQSRQLPLRR
jgi:sporulation protein YlmC with PRC-barrel domain